MKNNKSKLRSLLNSFINFFFPLTCIACGADIPPENYLGICSECFAKLELIKGCHCVKCGAPLPDGGEHCFTCKKEEKVHFEFVRSAGEYKGVIRELIKRFKYQNRDYYDTLFGQLIKTVIDSEKAFSEIDIIVPVPMHWIKKLKRGYNQAELLAAKAGEYLGKPVAKDLLLRKRNTRAQFGLHKEERKRNLKDSFKAAYSGLLKGKKVLLIDDIATSCATIESCSAALKKGGAAGVWAVTVARD